MLTRARSPYPGVVLVGSTGTTVLLLVIALVAIGAAMIAVAVWLVRSTRSDPPALGPLEAMAERRYRRADASGRVAHLDTARPPGAPAPAPIVPLDLPDEPEASAKPEASADAEIGEPSEQQPAPPAHDSQPTPPAAAEPVEESR